MQTTRRGFLAGLFGVSVIAVLPRAPVPVSVPVEPIDPFAIVAPDGWTYQWVRTALMGTPDPANVQARIDNNWTFVAPAQHPGAPVAKLEDAIETVGLILMQKTTIDVEKDAAKERQAHEARLLARGMTFSKQGEKA